MTNHSKNTIETSFESPLHGNEINEYVKKNKNDPQFHTCTEISIKNNDETKQLHHMHYDDKWMVQGQGPYWKKMCRHRPLLTEQTFNAHMT